MEWTSQPGALRGALGTRRVLFVLALVGVLAIAQPGSADVEQGFSIEAAAACRFWVAVDGSDAGSGSAADPWETLQHAVDSAPVGGCQILVEPGTYRGSVEIERRFDAPLVLKSAVPYQARLEHTTTVVDLDGAKNVVIEGFEMTHAGDGSTGFIVNMDFGEGVWTEDATLRNNIIHDSYDDDLLKIHAGVRRAVVEGNVFYNQGDGEQHMDVNSVTDVVVEDNVFFNDFRRSDRVPPESKHFMVIKDSGVADDGVVGSRRITVRRNVFMNWEGGREAFIRVGNGGKPYFEAQDVNVESNLFLGNSRIETTSPIGVSGARGVSFVNNTVVGDLPSGAYGFLASRKGDNPINEDLTFANNIWSDPTGTMDDFTSGEPADNSGLVLDNNLYWNDGRSLPSGDVVSPSDDAHRIVADPGLETDHSGVVTSVWEGDRFASGNLTIREEFVRLIETYAAIPASSVVVGAADPQTAAATDIWGSARDSSPDIGAWEAGADRSDARPVFSDDDTSIHEDDIEKIAAAGITLGCNPPANDRYCPDDPVTRAQMASFLARALELSSTDGTDFSDDDGSVHEDDIQKIAAAGITLGCNPPANDRYCPDDPVTRAQMASFLARALDL